jgi:hypothetical protein
VNKTENQNETSMIKAIRAILGINFRTETLHFAIVQGWRLWLNMGVAIARGST